MAHRPAAEFVHEGVTCSIVQVVARPLTPEDQTPASGFPSVCCLPPRVILVVLLSHACLHVIAWIWSSELQCIGP